MQAIERIRTALQKHAAAKTLAEAWILADENEDALSVESLTEVLAHIDKLEAENDNLRTVMMAAAVEIQEHWDAHCDADGYGPANLMRRLEGGYPEQYGYNAETVVRLEAEIERLRKDAETQNVAEVEESKDRKTWMHAGDYLGGGY